MIEIVLGPVLIAGGLAAIYVGLRGSPAGEGAPVATTPAALPAVTAEDLRLADVLNDLLYLREEKAALESQVQAVRLRLGASSPS